jgi:malonate transporter and related proteins
MIMLGYGFAKFDLIEEFAGRGISQFVFNVAVPALLFKTMATMGNQATAPWNLWFSFFGGLALTWVAATFVSRFITVLNLSGGAVSAMGGSYGNLALLGTPLALAHFGQAVAVPLGLILSIHAPILWFTGTLHRDVARHTGQLSITHMLKQLFLDLARNSIILALVAGSLWRLTGLGLNPVPEKMLTMLADASVPTALFALGVSLAGYSLNGSWKAMSVLIGLKMLFMPFAVFLLSHYIFTLPPLWAKIAVLFAAMPSGANAFLFAQRNDEALPAVSGAVAVGTALAAISCSILLYFMDINLI